MLINTSVFFFFNNLLSEADVKVIYIPPFGIKLRAQGVQPGENRFKQVISQQDLHGLSCTAVV